MRDVVPTRKKRTSVAEQSRFYEHTPSFGLWVSARVQSSASMRPMSVAVIVRHEQKSRRISVIVVLTGLSAIYDPA
jgi:hypothetical protein